jgi:hypothetical protein
MQSGLLPCSLPKRKTQKKKNMHKTSGDVTEQPRPGKGR